LDTVRLYQINNGQYQLIYFREGLKQKNKNFIHYIVPLLNGVNPDSFKLEIKSSFKLRFKMVLEETEVSHKKEQIFELWFSLFTGIMLVMIIYNLFLFFSVRDNIYLLYVLYILTVLFTQLSIFGVAAKYLWAGNEWLNYQSVNIFTSLVGIASLEFFKKFNQIKDFFPKADKVLNIHHVVYVLALIYSFSDKSNVPTAYGLISVNATVLSIVAIILGFKLMINGFRPAKFFLIAWILFIVGIVLYIMKDFGFLPLTFLTRYMMPIGSAMETVILSLALADRINILKKEKETSQAQALNEMKKNQQLIREQNIVLEQKVVERTAELEQTLMDLKQTQSQLVAAEKLASLGQLTAGIAHEINNPINFVSSNIEPLKNDIKDIIELLNIYQEKARSLNPAEFKSAKEFEDEIDLEYTIEEIDRLMKGIREGADRTTEIVSSLRTFSRTDEIALQTVDIHTIIDSTLTILKNNLGRIQVIRQYGEILPIEAYAGKLNQAIMNVVNNAMQAIFDCYEDESKGIIYIKTEQIDSMIKISISDNGSGIDPLYVDKIFEPFFTTKEVGKGTGLGLSITYGIIDQHSGKIYAEEHGNTGTKISIEIPIHQS
jgi:signal transduction histidine kinase